MSQNQIRTRFLIINIEIATLPEQEDIHGAVEGATIGAAQLLDAIATQCHLIIMSTSFICIPFVDKNVPSVAASLHGTTVYANGDPDIQVLCQNASMVGKGRFEQVGVDSTGNVIYLEVIYKH